MTVKQLVARSRALHKRLIEYQSIGFPKVKSVSEIHSSEIYDEVNLYIQHVVLPLHTGSNGERALQYFLATVAYIEREQAQQALLYSFSDLPAHNSLLRGINEIGEEALALQNDIQAEFPGLRPIVWLTPAIMGAFLKRQAEFDRIAQSKATSAQQPSAKPQDFFCNRNLLFAASVAVVVVTAVAASAFSPYPSH